MTDQPDNKQPDWEQLEYLVADIQRQLAPDATVSHNVKLPGIESETERQIDVLVEQNVGQYTMRVVIDCKDYAKPVNVKGIEEFHGLVNDVGAQKGALVCPRGFSKAAKRRARKLGIELYSPVDTDPHKWTATVSAPVVCDFRGMYISFGIRITTPKPFRLPERFFEADVFDEAGNSIGQIKDTAVSMWDSGEYPSEVGEHRELPIFPDQKTFMDNGYGDQIEAQLHANIRVVQYLYFGHLPIENVRGLKDEQTGAIVTNAFTTGDLDLVTVQNEWERLAEGESPPSKPFMTIVGLHCYGSDAEQGAAQAAIGR